MVSFTNGINKKAPALFAGAFLFYIFLFLCVLRHFFVLLGSFTVIIKGFAIFLWRHFKVLFKGLDKVA